MFVEAHFSGLKPFLTLNKSFMYNLLQITMDDHGVLTSQSDLYNIPFSEQVLLDYLLEHLEICPAQVTQAIRYLILAEHLLDTDPSVKTRLPEKEGRQKKPSAKEQEGQQKKQSSREKEGRQKKTSARKIEFEYQDLHPELARTLTLWRRQKAGDQSVPPYIILQNKTLQAIADATPTTEEELLAMPGYGPGLFARTGEEILQIVNDYLCPSNVS